MLLRWMTTRGSMRRLNAHGASCGRTGVGVSGYTAGQSARYWSYGDATDDEIANCLLEGGWQQFSHPLIKLPMVGFRAPITGTVWASALADYDPTSMVTLAVDANGRGLYAWRYADHGVLVDHTVIILGPHTVGEIVWTFHPGAPLPASRADASGARGLRSGDVVTVRMALNAGVTVIRHMMNRGCDDDYER